MVLFFFRCFISRSRRIPKPRVPAVAPGTRSLIAALPGRVPHRDHREIGRGVIYGNGGSQAHFRQQFHRLVERHRGEIQKQPAPATAFAHLSVEKHVCAYSPSR